MANLEQGLLLKNSRLGDKYFSLLVLAPKLALTAKPGQFVQIKCGASLDPYLRRPISIHHLNKQEGLIEFLIEKKGKGTLWLSNRSAGEMLDLLGPLGKGFTLKNATSLLVGGGIGVAPLLALGEALKERENPPLTLLGANSGQEILKLTDFLAVSQRVQIATVDGSLGKQGFVTDLLIRELDSGFKGYLYTCGPEPMLEAVAKIALEYGIPGEASLEARMACGFGVCLGCTCNQKKEDETYIHVCVDGPVLPLEVLIDHDSR